MSQQAYMNPSIEADSHGSPMEQAINQYNEQQNNENNALYLSSGMSHQSGGGRTLNIPKYLPTNKIPGPSYNGAVTIGEVCQGVHCSIPVTPTSENLIHNNLQSANPPPGATLNYPGTNRFGNNQINMPGVHTYSGTENNPGPFNIHCSNMQHGGSVSLFKYITHPETKKVYHIRSKKGKSIIKKYMKYIN
jgi:hypothetical protein